MTTMIKETTIPATDNPTEMRPSFIAYDGSDAALLLAITVYTNYKHALR